MKSQSNSQELDEILKDVWWHGEGYGTGLGVTQAHKTSDEKFEEAKAKLLQLALSCLPDKRIVERDPQIGSPVGMQSTINEGHNAAIDTMEQNMRAKFQ